MVLVTVAVPVVAENDVEAERVGREFARDELDSAAFEPDRLETDAHLIRSKNDPLLKNCDHETIPWARKGSQNEDKTLMELLP